MKKFLLIIMVLIAIITVGCGNSKYSDSVFIRKGALWVEKREYVHDFLDATENKDDDFLLQQLIEGKVMSIDKETKVTVLDELDNDKIVQVKFLQGRHKNKTGYTISLMIRDAQKERYGE